MEILENLQSIIGEITRKEGADEEALKGTAKGVKFEEDVEIALNGIVAPFKDALYPTGSTPGTAGSKKGDFVSELDGTVGRKVVFELKRKSISLTKKFFDEEIVEAMNNRGAQACVLIVHPEHGRVLGRPLRIWHGNVICCIHDPENNDTTALQVAYQLARYAAVSQDEGKDIIDLSFFKETIDDIVGRIEQITTIEKSMSKSLTSLESAKSSLNILKKDVLDQLQGLLKDIEGNREQELPE